MKTEKQTRRRGVDRPSTALGLRARRKLHAKKLLRKGKRGRRPNPRRETNPTAVIARPQTAPGPLTPSGSVGPSATAEVSQTVLIQRRRKRVMELVVDQHMTYAKAAEIVGVSTYTIAKDMEAGYEELKAETLRPLVELRAQEIARLNRNDRAILPQIFGVLPGETADPNTWSKRISAARRAEIAKETHTALTASSARRSKLLGLDAPTKIAHTDPTGTRRYHDLPDDDLEKLLREREKTVLGVVVEREEPRSETEIETSEGKTV